jgi:hypothetical protein
LYLRMGRLRKLQKAAEFLRIENLSILCRTNADPR